ncbi:MAG: hypothetical protein ACR2NP_10615 [Pirellulaceae bacterium]
MNRLTSRGSGQRRIVLPLSVVWMLVMVIPAPNVQGQTTADELYWAVQALQESLGEGPGPDQVRNQFMIRELETQSALGFTGDSMVLGQIANRFATAGQLSGPLAIVQSRLSGFMAEFNQSGSYDVVQVVGSLSQEVDAVPRSGLARSRDTLVQTLNFLSQHNQDTLSYYGNHYLTKRLQLNELVGALEALDLTSEPEDMAAFNRQINSFRQSLGQARQRFSLASTSYQTAPLAMAERRIGALQDQMFQYLIGQSARAGETFRKGLEQRKQAFVSREGTPRDPSDRLYQAELGRWIELLNQRAQMPGLDAASRKAFSQPNVYVTIEESLVNRLGAQTVSQVDHVDEVVVGSRAVGWSYTSNNVNLDFLPSSNSAMVRITLNGSVYTNAYSKEDPITAYTNGSGSLAAYRDLQATVGNLSVYQPQAWAQVSSQLTGTSSRIPLLAGIGNRIANQRFQERRWRADEIASERARDRLLVQFTDQTNVALSDGFDQIRQARDRRDELIDTMNQTRREISEGLAEDEQGEVQRPYDMIDEFMLPRFAVNTSNSQLLIAGTLEGSNRLAAMGPPPSSAVPAEIRLQLHESLVSNAIAPIIQGRLVQNWQFRNLADSASDGEIELPPEPDEDRKWAIQFEKGRPIQIEFDNNELAVTIFGSEFRQGRQRFTDPISIHVRFRVVNHEGELKLVRSSRAVVEFTYLPREGETLSAEAIGFRQFLQDNLDEATKRDPLEDAIVLPANLIPLDFIEDEEGKRMAGNLLLVELTSQNGWVTAGWNYVEGGMGSYITNTSAIWNELPVIPAPEGAAGDLGEQPDGESADQTPDESEKLEKSSGGNETDT